MAEFPANLNLASLNGSNGFRLDGVGTGDYSGVSVSSAGDFNGDGFADLIIGAERAEPGGSTFAGASYVVFGRAGGFAANLNLATLDGTNGFRFDGGSISFTGSSVSAAGDVNGDGFEDIVIGASNASSSTANVAFHGTGYVLFGRAGSFAPVLDGSIANGTDGFRFDGAASGDSSGASVSSAGDLNGDGIDDLIVGAPGTDLNGTLNVGTSYVVFGRADGFPGSLNPASLDGKNGFRLDGLARGDRSGSAVSSAGDVNGDGFADLVVGVSGFDANGIDSGASYVVFGRAGGFDPRLVLDRLDGRNGFRLTGAAAYDRSGYSVSSAGDINGDGLTDIIVGADGADTNGTDSGASYVVFGTGRGFSANLALGSLDGKNGFRLDGAAGSRSGYSVSSAGDVNGDGFADVVVGSGTGDASYVVFGRADGFGTRLDLTRLGEREGFRITGAVGTSASFSVSSAGDVNGDGFDDLIVGAPAADPNGVTDSGASYIVFGRAPDRAVQRSGTEADNTIRGGAFDDSLRGRGGDDRLFGGAGNDQLTGDDGDDRLDGGAGDDSLRGGNDNDRLDGGIGADRMDGGLGDDTYLVDNAGDRVVEFAGEGRDTVLTTLNYTLGDNIENLTLGGTANLSGTGNGLDNVLTGNAGRNILSGGAGNDTLNGGGGVDRLVGGTGDDTYVIGAAGVTVVEAAGEGTDTVRAAANFTLGANLENLVLTGAGGNGTGNGLANSITGNAGNNVLDGLSGADTLTGGLGNDTYVVDNAGDVIFELAGQGTDIVRAATSYTLSDNLERLVLTSASNIAGTGNGLANTITGSTGANTIAGLGGADTLTGGAGRDTFVFRAVSDSTVAASGRDTIGDFNRADTDRIDLTGIDANAGLAGDQAFGFIGTAAFSNAAGQLRYETSGSNTLVTGDVDGNGAADFSILLTGQIALARGDFLL